MIIYIFITAGHSRRFTKEAKLKKGRNIRHSSVLSKSYMGAKMFASGQNAFQPSDFLNDRPDTPLFMQD